MGLCSYYPMIFGMLLGSFYYWSCKWITRKDSSAAHDLCQLGGKQTYDLSLYIFGSPALYDEWMVWLTYIKKKNHNAHRLMSVSIYRHMLRLSSYTYEICQRQDWVTCRGNLWEGVDPQLHYLFFPIESSSLHSTHTGLGLMIDRCKPPQTAY